MFSPALWHTFMSNFSSKIYENFEKQYLDELKLRVSPYQIQYKKNFEMLKPKYQLDVCPFISYHLIVNYSNLNEKKTYFFILDLPNLLK